MKILRMGDGTEFPIIPDAIADREPVLKDGDIASYGYVTLGEAVFGSYNLDLSLDGNSIYVIRHHHNGEYKDLDEVLKQNIYILGDAILKFEGGKLSNCNIICYGKLIIDAPPVQIFENVDIDVITNINVYPEWFGVKSELLVDNSAIFNDIIKLLNSLGSNYNLILTSRYYIKDTIYLRQRVNLIGSCGTDVFMSVVPEDFRMGSGFMFDFDDNNKYVIDSDFALEQKAYNGESVTYNRMWFDIEGTYTDGTTDANGNPNKYPVYPNYNHGVYRKQTIIRNISIQPVKKTPYNAPVFGGIRLIDSYFGIIESVHISGVAVGISVHKSWGYKFSNITLYACLCGFYFGKQNTAQHISDCTVESNWFNGTYTWDKTELLWKEDVKPYGDILFPPYDGKGNRPTDADFNLTDNPFVINSVGIINESDDFGKDQNKIMVDNSIFQNIDCVSLSNRGFMSFDFCYFEGALKCILYTYAGNIKWKNPSYQGTNIHPYGVATIEGQITVEGISDIKCYPHHTYEELKNGMLGNRIASYVIPDAHNYYDKFTITPVSGATYNQGVPSNGAVGTDGIAAAKTLVPINNTYYVGWRVGERNFNYNYPEIASGLTGKSFTSFKNILNRFNPDIATFYTYGYGTDFSGAGVVGGTVPLLKDKKFIFVRIQDKDNNDNNATVSFPLLNTMRLFNSEIILKNNFQLYRTARNKVDGQTPIALDYLFEVSGKCRIECNDSDGASLTGQYIKLAAGPNNEPVDLELVIPKYWEYPANILYNPNNVKFKAKFRTARGTATLTNTVPPSVGMEVGETWVYTPSGTATATNPDQYTLGKTIFVWNGINWVGVDTNNQYYGINANWEDDNFNVSFYVSGTLCNQILYTK